MTGAHPIRTFHEGCDAGELRYQRCTACGRVQPYPRVHCLQCKSDALEWLLSRRFGTLASFTVVHRAARPRDQARAPYVLALVDLGEGFRMMMNVEHTERPLAIGATIAVDFVDGDDGHRVVHGRVR